MSARKHVSEPDQVTYTKLRAKSKCKIIRRQLNNDWRIHVQSMRGDRENMLVGNVAAMEQDHALFSLRGWNERECRQEAKY